MYILFDIFCKCSDWKTEHSSRHSVHYWIKTSWVYMNLVKNIVYMSLHMNFNTECWVEDHTEEMNSVVAILISYNRKYKACRYHTTYFITCSGSTEEFMLRAWGKPIPVLKSSISHHDGWRYRTTDWMVWLTGFSVHVLLVKRSSLT